MSMLLILECTTDPAHTKDLTDFLRDELFHTRGFDGCNSITIHRNQDDPNNLVFIENWDRRNNTRNTLDGAPSGATWKN